MIFVFSLSRSGSTWLGKIFDSHPDVFYLHEPDIVDRGLDILPYWFEQEPSSAQIAATAAYLQRLGRCRSARAVGTRPFFDKTYRSPFAERLRRGFIYMDKLAERTIAKRFSHFPVPDIVDGQSKPMLVIKSVSATGRAEAMIRAASGSLRPILLIRDPRSYVSSMIRGARMGVMEPAVGLGALARTSAARELNFPPGHEERLDEVETHAWTWMIANLEGRDAVLRANGVVLRFEALARNPLAEARDLFSRVGLEWHPATERFLARASTGNEKYYSVSRNPESAIGGWRKQLKAEDASRVEAIASLNPVGQAFLDNPG